MGDMKIIILDDAGTTLYEDDNPGYIHLPMIMDGKDEVSCDDDTCQDPRCLERREECEALLEEWQRNGQELGFVYHYLGSDRDDLDEFQRLPNHQEPAKVKLESYTRNEVVLSSGERLKFSLPKLNGYSEAQVMFSTDKWDASLYPWDESLFRKSRAA
jgi:hypothetical protein